MDRLKPSISQTGVLTVGNLQSSMDRLKPSFLLLFFQQLQYLQSSMDRLKRGTTMVGDSGTSIYNPVWID